MWLVRPPCSVTMPTTLERSRVAVSAGARSMRDQDALPVESGGTPGAGTPRTAAIARSPTSRKSVARSAK